MNVPPQDQLREASEFLLARARLRPGIGVILGSGLAGVAQEAERGEAVDFGAIPHLVRPTVVGHPGRLVLAKWLGHQIVFLEGRLHGYEGYSPWQVTFPVRLLHALGVSTLIVTNAAGALNPDFVAGDLMLISDHVNLPAICGSNPLQGLDESLGPRFVDMSGAYDADLLRLTASIGARLALPMREGVYIMVSGPSYETSAELRLLRGVGGDAVGMSTTSEVIVAAQLGMRVLGISCITNQASGVGHPEVTHAEVLAKGRDVAPELGKLIGGVVAALPG